MQLVVAAGVDDVHGDLRRAVVIGRASDSGLTAERREVLADPEPVGAQAALGTRDVRDEGGVRGELQADLSGAGAKGKPDA